MVRSYSLTEGKDERSKIEDEEQKSRKRSRSKELCVEKEGKEVKIGRTLRAESAGPESISHTDL